MTSRVWLGLLLLVIVVGGGAYYYYTRPSGSSNQPVNNPNIQVTQPVANGTVASPLAISGQAVGGWYFEASFPIKLYDSGNTLIGQTTAQAQSDWMTTAMVPFTATLTFPAQTAGSTGSLVFEKDNPSGEPANADSYSVAVMF
jgi:hypothetical protein